MDINRLKQFVDPFWDDSILPSITEYIRIPNKSPHFDPQWVEHGYMEDAVTLMVAWATPQLAGFPGATLEVVRLPGRTPLIFIEVPGDSDDTVLLYGHLDKQPEMKGWAEGMGPWIPVLKGDKLYGRGGADDGYAIYACLCALKALAEQKVPRGRCVIMIEACEESGSYDLPFYVDHLMERIGKPSLVVCLDSGCGDWDRLWLTTSLRGIAGGTLTVRVLTEGVHSGDASGIVPSSFRITRGLLSRLEDEATGEIRLPDLYVQIPPQRIEQAKAAAQVLGEQVHAKFPFAGGTRPMADDLGANGAEPDLAAAARGDRHGRLSRAGRCRQRAAALLDRPAQPAHAADARRRGGGAGAQADAWRPIRRTARRSRSRAGRARAAGTRRRSRRGSRRRWPRPRRRRSASPRPTWAKAARSPSWACWARSSRPRSSSSPACWDRTPMRTGPTSFCTSRRASA